MHEQEVADQLRSEGVDLIVSLPCDKNKGFTDLIQEEFRVVDVTREEDGVGICAGAALMGKRAVISIQSSGLGNMMNALMSLTDCYKLPLVVLASWRGVDGEKIEAQIPFNSKIPQMLDVYGIHHCEVEGPEDIPRVGDSIREAFGRSEIHVVLIHPKLWEGAKRVGVTYPPRARSRHIEMDDTVAEPSLTRLQAIRAVMDCVGDGDIVVSNIGVPSKEVMASAPPHINERIFWRYKMLFRKILVRTIRILFCAQHADIAGQININTTRHKNFLPVSQEGHKAILFFLIWKRSFCILVIKWRWHCDDAMLLNHIIDFGLIPPIVCACITLAVPQK